MGKPRYAFGRMAALALLGAGLALGGCQRTPLWSTDAYDPDDYQTGLHDYVAGQSAWAERDTVSAADYYLKAIDEDPENDALRQRAFQLLLSDGRFDEALKIAGGLQSGSSAYGGAQMLVALDDLRHKRFAAANKALDMVEGSGFDTLLKPIARAWALAGAGDIEGGRQALKHLNDMPPLNIFAREHEALILAYAGRWAEAAPLLDDLVNSESVGVRVVIDYAARLSRHGDKAKALDLLEGWHMRNPRIASLNAALAELKARGEMTPLIQAPAEAVAAALFRTSTELRRQPTASSAIVYARLATFLQPGLSDAYVMIGDLLDSQGRYQAAYDAYGRVTADSALYHHALLRRALMLDQMGNGDAAIEALQALLAAQPDFDDARISLAGLLRQKAAYAAAIAEYDKLLENGKTPAESDWVLYYSRGIAYEQSGAWDQAEADFEAALKLRPDEPYVLNYLGYSWLDRGMHIEEAKAMIEKAIEQRPNDGFIVDSLGWGLYLTGEYEEAVKYLEQAVALQPGDPTISDHLGDAYWKVGRILEARFKWQHALHLDPSDEQARLIREKMDLGLTLVEAEHK